MLKHNLILADKHLLLTRSAKDNPLFATKLTQLGAKVSEFPCIKITKNKLGETMLSNLKRIKEYDWIILTSANGVAHFLQQLGDQGIDITILKSKKIVAIGSETAAVLKARAIPVHSMPTDFLTEKIPNILGEISNSQILLPRSNLANRALSFELTKLGAHVVDIPIYVTTFLPEANDTFQKITEQNDLEAILFTSSSTVTGFLKRVTNSTLRLKFLTVSILAIGPVTAKTAQEAGFQNITIADTHTTNGMIVKLKEIYHDE